MPSSPISKSEPPDAGSARFWLFRRYSLLLVPILYLALVIWIQPADRLGDPEKAPWLGRLLYDDYDPAAYALRGLNAALGRIPGRLQDPEPVDPEEFARELERSEPADPDTPYFLEYPHAALWVFRLGFVFAGLDRLEIPRAVADGRYHNLVVHEPRNETERRLWRALRRALQFYSLLGIGCLVGLMVLIGTGYEAGGRLSGPVQLLLLPGAMYFSLSRFDAWPALLTALSLACLGRQRIVGSAVFLGAATMIKVYPLLLVPLVVRYIWSNHKHALTWVGCYGATLIAVLLPSLIVYGWEATWSPYRYQLSRWAIEGWSLYGYVLPPFLVGNPVISGLFRNGVLMVAMATLIWNRPLDLASLLRRGAIVLILFVALQVFYSPQWILWLTPLLLPLAQTHRPIRRLAIALDLLTFLSFPIVFDSANSALEPILRAMLIFARFAVLAALIATLWRNDLEQGG
jgi:hypothetical protein